MGKRVLTTGGAGFVGSHLADELLDYGYEVRAIDNLFSQVHGDAASRPDYLDNAVDFIEGDVRDRRVMTRALKDVDAVFHLVPGHSMPQLAIYRRWPRPSESIG